MADEHMDQFREPKDFETLAVPRWWIVAALHCAVYCSREPVVSDAHDMLVSLAEEMLDRSVIDPAPIKAEWDVPETDEYDN